MQNYRESRDLYMTTASAWLCNPHLRCLSNSSMHTLKLYSVYSWGNYTWEFMPAKLLVSVNWAADSTLCQFASWLMRNTRQVLLSVSWLGLTGVGIVEYNTDTANLSTTLESQHKRHWKRPEWCRLNSFGRFKCDQETADTNRLWDQGVCWGHE